MNSNTKKLCTLAMLAALAYIVNATIQIPVVLFLRYTPTDVILTIGGFLYGPMAALAMIVTTAFVHMLTLSRTGAIGFVMNVIAGASFVCTAAVFYKKNRTLKGAILGLITGIILMTVTMLLWNYILTPIFMEQAREEIVPLLFTAITPFNLLKGSLNAALIMLLYKPVKKALQSARMMPPSENVKTGKFDWGIALVSLFVIVSCVLWVMVLRGII